LIPKPFDPRLIVHIAPAVAKAAMDSGVARRPIADFEAYRQQLQQFVYQSGTIMKPVYAAARKAPPHRSRIAFAEGEDERVLRATQIIVEERLARPVLVGRPGVIENRIKRFGLSLRPGEQFEIVNPEQDPRHREFWMEYHRLMMRRGVTAQYAKLEMRRRTTLIASMLVRKGAADGMICGTISTAARHLQYIDQVIGKRGGATTYAAMNALILPDRQLFIVDTHINLDPTAEQLAEITLHAAEVMRRFRVEPKVALLSHSNFGSHDDASATKMRNVLALLRAREPELQVDGEMHGDCALDESIRRKILPETTLQGPANLLVMPNLDAANIAYNLLKTAAGNNVVIGSILLGPAAPVHILTPSATVRRIVNMTVLTVAQANAA
jgi:malate dehydrogenase (oxaloacetate-decarboxylating)(NADP+)